MSKRIFSEEEQRVTARCMDAWQAYKKKTGCNQTSMAEKLGFNQSAFSQYIAGAVPPNILFVLNFASIVGVDPAMLWPEKATIIPQLPRQLARLMQIYEGLAETDKTALLDHAALLDLAAAQRNTHH